MHMGGISNLISATVVGIALLLPEPYRATLLSTGSYAFAAGITNSVAIHMLFDKVPFLYGSGVIPARFDEFRQGIRTLILEQFFTHDHIRRFLASARGGGNNLSSVAESLDFDKVFAGLTETIMQSSFGGLLAMAGGAKALEPLKEPIKRRLKSMLDEGLATSGEDGGGSAMVDSLHASIAAIVDARLAELTPQMVKAIVEDMIRRHLGWLVVWGNIFGGCIGLAISLL